ncbi:hypothetical protein PRIPAC_78201 [Pristionchus pacificus]|uniref:SPT2 homolog N-terminal domain-containing protein n=1 Tax=Pristionchus pacificus TaxID=54126 RepID=A0A2A6CB70_PRIPA|nr:hypothetical protein PRIPAC_78201 [Pristionchus pacificus]|eukprot:PDM75293.1 hypothetical protein PRIPAC_43487 [Pristionchus pacificus]
MDFASLLHQANKNLKHSSKKVSEAQDEVSRERMRQLDQIRLQKLERLRKEELAKQRREDERRAQFQIPKKVDSAVDPDRIKAFKAKQEEERRKKEKEEAKKKEELIKLRLAANGGKANKKIAKHFGADVIDLQVKFGQDRDHIETLHKYKERDEEEAQKLAEHYRNGVVKAFANKKTVEEKVKDGARLKQSGIPKKNLTLLSSDGFEKGKQIRPPKSDFVAGRKRAAEEALDFNSLMKKAANISNGKEKMGREKEKEETIPTSSYRAMKERYETKKDVQSSSSSTRPSSSFKIPKPTLSHVKAPYVPNGLLKKREEEPLPSGIVLPKPQTCIRSKPKGENSISKEDVSRMTTSSSSSSSSYSAPAPKTLAYPTDDRGKRILPGDIRYKTWLEEQKRIMEERNKNVPPPPQPMTTKDKEREKAKRMEKIEKSKSKSLSIPSSSSSSSSHRQMGSSKDSSSLKSRPHSSSYSSTSTSHSSSKISKYEEEKKKIMMREQRMKEAKRKMEEERREMERSRERNGGRGYGFTKGYDSDEDEDEEESDLDDFIDDSGDFDDLSRRDFEETLRSINKNYDTKKWKMNERLIDERSMHSNWRQVEKEERASARAGLKDDLREALKHKSEAL